MQIPAYCSRQNFSPVFGLSHLVRFPASNTKNDHAAPVSVYSISGEDLRRFGPVSGRFGLAGLGLASLPIQTVERMLFRLRVLRFAIAR
jgi:hypothetical protein